MCYTYNCTLSSKYTKLFIGMAAAVFIAGCIAPQGQNSWDDDKIQPLDKERVIKAAYNALVDSQTYIPAAGVLVFTIGDWDRKTSDWASSKTPIFGSRDTASSYSDYMLWSLIGETALTGFYIPGNNNPDDWDSGRSKNFLVEGGAIGTTALTTFGLQSITDRTRPNGESRSFPSVHSSVSFSAATLSNRNLDSINMPDSLRTGLQAGNILLATSVAWARVENQKHFPSDVLAGAALGHFMSVFIFDTFMNLPNNVDEFLILPYNRGIAVSYSVKF